MVCDITLLQVLSENEELFHVSSADSQNSALTSVTHHQKTGTGSLD